MAIDNLIVGNFSCANRGDLSILRGLLNLLDNDKKNVTIVTQDIQSAKEFLGLEYNFISENIFFSNKSVLKRYFFRLLMIMGLFPIRYKFFNKNLLYKNVYFVGGSYLIDAYGYGKFDLLGKLITKSENIKLIGHSVGPFNDWKIRRIAKVLFKQCDFIGVRDSISFDYVINRLKLKDNIALIPDTAFVAIEKKVQIRKQVSNKKRIVITVRELSPFDKILNISQDEYNKKYLNLVNYLLLKGYEIVVASMCTSINGYHKDDRITAKKIFNSINHQNFKIVEAELSDLDLANLFSKCDLIIGTRLHSCIISMSVGVPAIAVYYEHKSQGIFQKLNLENFSINIRNIDNFILIDELISQAIDILFINKLAEKINEEKEELYSLKL